MNLSDIMKGRTKRPSFFKYHSAMKRLLVIPVTLAIVLVLGSCRRHYQVNYVHVAEDSLQQNVDTPETDIQEDETYFEVPATPRPTTASDILNSKNRVAAKEAERLYSGEDGYEEVAAEEEP